MPSSAPSYEAKGIAAAQLADQFGVHVRTGGPNAGHTAYIDGKKFVGRSIPMGFANLNAELVIGPGAVIDLDVLSVELNDLEAAGFGVKDRLWIDYKAGIITSAQHHGEGGVHGYAHQSIGSTGEGVGLARIAKISRNSILDPTNELYKFEEAQFSEKLVALGLKPCLADTVEAINDWLDSDDNVLLEGTQGSGLSLTHGPQWPYCTSSDTNAAQLASDAGVSPSLIKETILVARTFPIRVAGNSGPLPNETTWEALGQAEERTTVTQKVRRVAEWDSKVVRKAVLLNRPAKLVLTFMNYLYPDLPPAEDWAAVEDGIEMQFIRQVEEETGGDVVAVSYDPYKMIVKPGELEYV
ncbi:MAG: adenylosuccinate synthetase [Patescibacteria group bacterium]|nr:adenylosuccinate synthetase [Patescibacteria group bacterium]